MPRKAFFRHYRIDPGAGSLRDASVLPDGVEAIEETSVFVPESGLSMMWAAPDSAGQAVIAEMSLLADGSYEPVVCHPELNIEAEDGSPVDALFPFLMADGVTLYYASDNPELSLGGYDIFFSRRDGDTFMQPQNMGMPYNSPANDYLLAIDEITGTGWWATDRNSPDSDSLTIYRFIPMDDIFVYTDHHTTRHCFIVQRYCLVRMSSTACANKSVDLTTTFHEWTEQRGHSRTCSGFAES